MSVRAAGGTADALAARLDALRATPAWGHYTTAREHVLRMLDRQAGDAPSAYWAEELAGFEYLLDASPLIVERLRHHSYHVTGLKPYDYRTGKDEARERFAEKLSVLRELAGDALVVAEPPDLGGFGFEIDGALYNIDTLKYLEALIALERGEVLAELREPAGRRRIVWEIGAGWGGFAYAFKRLFADVTYVITDLPQLFLFSGTYLPTVFPGARVAWLDDAEAAAAFTGWADADFVFAPHFALGATRPPHVDLTVNTVSFQEMTTAQVEAYVAHAHALGSPYLYSLNRERGGYNAELTSVHEVMARWYWPHAFEILPVPYTRMLDRRDRKRSPEQRARDYRHVVGWRRDR